jgi:membrane-associated phospholipid phosphatase
MPALFRSPRARPALLAAAAAAVGVAVVYVVALGSSRGLSFDQRALAGSLPQTSASDLQRLTAGVLRTIDIGSLLLLGGAVLLLARVTAGRAGILAVALILAGSNATTQALKPLLAWLDPLGGEAARGLRSAFPSGHATIAMSLALAFLVAVPVPVRPVAAVFAAAYAAAVGVSLLVLIWHFPSDVAAGYLVAAAWAGVAIAWLRSRPGDTHARPEAVRRGYVVAAAVLALGFLALVAAAVGRRSTFVVNVNAHRPFVAAVVLVAALSAVVVVAATVLLGLGDAAPVSPGDGTGRP